MFKTCNHNIVAAVIVAYRLILRPRVVIGIGILVRRVGTFFHPNFSFQEVLEFLKFFLLRARSSFYHDIFPPLGITNRTSIPQRFHFHIRFPSYNNSRFTKNGIVSPNWHCLNPIVRFITRAAWTLNPIASTSHPDQILLRNPFTPTLWLVYWFFAWCIDCISLRLLLRFVSHDQLISWRIFGYFEVWYCNYFSTNY